MIVLLDSGIWISGLQFDGIPLKALEKALIEDEIAICDRIEEEITRVLTEKFGWHIRHVRQSLAIYTHNAIHAAATGRLKGMCRDAKDAIIFECAVNSDAKLIVSGDQDILTVGIYEGIRVVTARKYVSGAP